MRQVAVVTTGFFDGVHLGHRHVLETLVSSARERGEEALVVTLWPHPRTVLQQDAREFRLLTSLEEKRALLLACGVDRMEVLPFTRELAALTAAQYLQLLRDRFGASLVVMGYDNRIGSDRMTIDDLKATPCSGTPHPSDAPAPPNVSCVPALPELVSVGPLPASREVASSPLLSPRGDTCPDGAVPGGGHARCTEQPSAISSTKIRTAVKAGEVEQAAAMLGYRYSLYGAVVAGNRLGRTIGFPTANMQLYEPLKLVPGNGVFAVDVEVLDRRFKGMCNVGIRPTVGGTIRTVETHILDFDEDIYGLPLRIAFLRKIRDEIRFPSLDALREQLLLDRDAVRAR